MYLFLKLPVIIWYTQLGNTLHENVFGGIQVEPIQVVLLAPNQPYRPAHKQSNRLKIFVNIRKK